MREEKGKFLSPAGCGTFLSNGLPFGGRKILGSRSSAVASTHASERNGVRIAGMWFGLWEWRAVHLLTDGLLNDSAAYFHEIALWA